MSRDVGAEHASVARVDVLGVPLTPRGTVEAVDNVAA